jgi:hypothetical protein
MEVIFVNVSTVEEIKKLILEINNELCPVIDHLYDINHELMANRLVYVRDIILDKLLELEQMKREEE